MVRIEDRRPYVAFPTQEESKRFEKTQVEMIRSPVILGQCLRQPEIAQLPEVRSKLDPLKWLSQGLSIANVNESELFQVKFEGPNPANAAKIANAIVDVYLKRHSNDAREETQKVIDVLEEEKAKRTRDLQVMREHVRDLTKQVTGKEMPATRRGGAEPAAVANPVAALEDRLTAAEVDREVLEAQYQAARQALASREKVDVANGAIEQAVAADAEVVSLNSQLAKQRAAMNEYEQASTQPQELEGVKKLAKRIAATEELLDKRKDEVRKLRTAEMRDGVVKERRTALKDLEAKLESQKLLEKLLRDRLADERAKLEKYGDQSLNLEFARNEMERSEDVFRRIADRTTALQTEQAAQARVSLWSAAIEPVAPQSSPLKVVAMAGGACFVLPLVLAVLWEYRVRRISHIEQIHDEVRMRVLGEITAMPARPMLPGRRAAARFAQQRSTFEESVSSLRTSLILGHDTENLQVVAVASAVSREGKSSVAAQLANNMANASGEPTLLIDTDLRDPDVHHMFGISLDPGLAEVLTGQVSLERTISISRNGRVQMLPAGRASVSPHTLFNNGQFATLLEKLKAQYRYIVIDCPPLLAASEALVVAKAADGVLLCTMREVSRMSQVTQARDRLLMAGARVPWGSC